MDVVEPVKFLYTASLRLDKPFALGEGGSAFAPRVRNAAYEALRHLVDCALSRKVDFLFLRGELCDAHCGSRGFRFLTEQMTRLSEAGIACYILNEGSPIDARWLTEFPDSVSWISRQSDREDAGAIICGACEISLAQFLEFTPPPLQGITPDESGPGGAWIVSLPITGGEPEREFVELDALRWEFCELDVTRIKTEKDLTSAWHNIKDGFRKRVKRPVLLTLKLTGLMMESKLFYGNDFIHDPAAAIKKLNAGEISRENCVLVDSLEDSTQGADTREADNAFAAVFRSEADFFKNGIDPRVGLFEALKERGLLKRVLASSAAPLLENLTESDVKFILKEVYGMANHGLFKREADAG